MKPRCCIVGGGPADPAPAGDLSGQDGPLSTSLKAERAAVVR